MIRDLILINPRDLPPLNVPVTPNGRLPGFQRWQAVEATENQAFILK